MVYKPITVIGSFPDKPGEINYVIDRQLRHGINIVCDGQLRCDMNIYFANTIEGFDVVSEKPVLNRKISGLKPKGLDILVSDLRMAQGRIAKNAYSKVYPVELKANLTGPVTLGFSAVNSAPLGEEALKLYDGFYRTDKNNKVVNTRFWKDIGVAMGKIVKAYETMGVRHIQIDEPMVSANKKSTIPMLEIALAEIIGARKNRDTKFYMHSCGPIGQRYNDFVKLEGIEALSFEFAGTPSNLELISRESLESNNKKLLLGIIKSNEPEPDDVLKEVYRGVTNDMYGGRYDDPELQAVLEPHINKCLEIYYAAAKKVGEENILQINPDCGLGGFRQLGTKATIAAVAKLRILQEVQKRISER
jgi:methionine synthase II (cobalamin-independent)